MTTCEAVQNLRIVSGLSQQAFAHQLGISIRAVANYEKERTPNRRVLFKMAEFAAELDRPDLVTEFRRALGEEFDFPEGAIGDLERSALLVLILNLGKSAALTALDKELAKLTKKAGENPVIMAYPEVFHGDHSPDYDARIEYVDAIRAEIKQRLKPSATEETIRQLARKRRRETGEEPTEARGAVLHANPDLAHHSRSELDELTDDLRSKREGRK